MKVAYLLASFPNTSETFIINEIAEAQRQGIEVRVFSLYRPQGECPHGAARDLAGRVTYFDDPKKVPLPRLLLTHARLLLRHRHHYLRALFFALTHRENATLWNFKVAAYFAQEMRGFRPDLIHTHFAYDSARLTMMVSKMTGVPYTFTIHGWGDLYHHPPPDLREIMLGAKKTITVCHYNRRHLLETYRMPEEQVAVIRCGISPAFQAAVSHEGREKGLILSVGRLHFHKAFHVLVEACNILRERGISFRCCIVGEGDLRQELEGQISSLGLEKRVELLGARSNDEVRQLLLKAEVFAMSSVVETVGLAAVEALACEVPAVATRVYGVPEMIRENETGLLAEPGASQTIADHLESLLSRDDLRRRMGRTGRSLVMQEHNLPVQVQRLVAVWAA